MITKYTELCIICNRRASEVHHLCFGKGVRELADADSLTAPFCEMCHDALHRGKETMLTQKMSRIIGQLEFEKNKVAEGRDPDEAREMFRKRYGVSFL